VRRFRRGDEDAATALYLRYAQRLEAAARTKQGANLRARFDPEDVVQSVFRTFFRRAAAGSYDVIDGDELWSLLLVVTLNKARKQVSRHLAGKRDARSTTVDADASLARAQRREDSLEALRIVIDEFTESLDPELRSLVEMRVEGHEVAEIAARLGRSKRTVERNLQRIRQTLHEQIDGTQA
jgi:RNA polymerase sigma-70 factor (ECF subfamily)